jgi:ATP-dependent RNA helicase DeaD
VEHEQIEPEAPERAAVARNQNVVYVLPHDAGAVAQFLDPALERIDPEEAALQVLVLTPDAETTMAVAEAATRSRVGIPTRVLPVTAAPRAARLLRRRPATLIIAAPTELLALIGGATIKLDALRTLIIAWADTIVEAGLTGALESVMAEVPKEAGRVVVAAHLTPEVEAIIERYARRARRAITAAPSAAPTEGIDVQYVATSPSGRAAALRRLLDDLDPDRVAVYARTDATAVELASLRQALGYEADDPAFTITRGAPVADASLVVLFELPLTREELRALAAPGTAVVALVTPRQLGGLRALAAPGRVLPHTLSPAPARAREHEERLRAELRSVLAEGIPAREILALEPLLNEYDGTEVAGAALRLLERERQRAAQAARAAAALPHPSPGAAPATPTVAAGRPGPVTRIYINAGLRDHVSPRDLVGAIANEAGISGDRIGRIDLRESHSLVELDSTVAEQVVARLTGATIRGRRIVARIDQDRHARGREGDAPRSRATGSARAPRAPRPSRPSPPPPTPRPLQPPSTQDTSGSPHPANPSGPESGSTE